MAESDTRAAAIRAGEAPLRARGSGYPAHLQAKVVGREKRPLGDLFGLGVFGVNHTRLAPGAWSALHHRHSRQDEFVYILEGTPTLVTDIGETLLSPGMCAGFPAGGTAHHLENRTDADVVVLEIGDRTPGDEGTYPNDDLKAAMGPDGRFRYTRKDGSPL
ncbi:MAG TPA: cupin domain-containing protein [Acetobacteraceae bacterium]|nr:cupin domain-containing protein [Acetobacteraceae bacterium]